MGSKIRVAVRVLLVAALAWLVYLRATSREGPPATPPPAGTPAPVVVVTSTSAVARGSSTAPPPASARPTPARIRLPRAEAISSDAGTGAGTPAAPRLRIADLGGKLVDRRADPGADAPSELELVHAGLDTIREDIEECLEQWRGTDAQAEGEVMIAFQLDESGLTDSWVVRDAELPFGIRTCFASAAYGVDWSHIVRQPAEISERFVLEREDAGR